MIKIKFLARKFFYYTFLRPLFQAAQHFYEKSEGSGSGTLVMRLYQSVRPLTPILFFLTSLHYPRQCLLR